MRNVLICRRTFIALVAIFSILAMALVNHVDTSAALASVAMALAGSNAAEAAFKAKFQKEGTPDV